MAVIEKQFGLHKVLGTQSVELQNNHSLPDEIDRPVVSPEEEAPELDLIQRFRSNLDKVDDLTKRLGFMNSEIQSVLGIETK